MSRDLRGLLEPYLGQDRGPQAQQLRVWVKVSTAYNDETYSLYYDVRSIEALDARGEVISFRDPETGQALDGAQINWREPLERLFWALEERYGGECWSDDGVTFLSLTGEDWPENEDDLEGLGRLKLPETVLLDLDGNVLDIQETTDEDFLEYAEV